MLVHIFDLNLKYSIFNMGYINLKLFLQILMP